MLGTTLSVLHNETNKNQWQRKNLKGSKGRKESNSKESPVGLSVDFSAEALQIRRQCYDIFKALKGKNCQPSILYPAKLSFRYEGEIKAFPDKQKLTEFTTNIPTCLARMLKKFFEQK